MVLVHDRQVTEALANHEVQRIGRARVSLCAERVLGHDLCNGNVLRPLASSNNPEGKILGSENTSNMVVFVSNQDAVLPLRGHELCGLCNGGGSRDLQGWAGLQGEDGARRGFACWAHAAGGVLLLVQVGLDLAADGLRVGR